MEPMTISASVNVLLRSKDRVVEQFYDRLLSRYPELRKFFESRDLRFQASMVTMALVHVEGFYSHRFPATEHYLHVIGHRHYDLGVREDDLLCFRDVLLESLQEFLGDAWTAELAGEWQQALDLAISTMREGYRREFHY